MGLWEISIGHQTWSDYVSSQEQIAGFNQGIQKQTKALMDSRSGEMQIGLDQRNYELALEQGLGAISADMLSGMAAVANSIDFGFQQVANGIDKLNADFNLLMGEVIWKLETQGDTLVSILMTLQAPLDTQAKELRQRAEYAYQNGWYDEALNDFLESERKNYQDFAVHRSIGNIYLYHSIDLTKSLDYFRKASKYARPRDTRQAAEAEYFAAVVCFLQKDLNQALSHMKVATELNRQLHDAFYMHACFAAAIGDIAMAVNSLERAIEGDPRYYERAKHDRLFDSIRPEVQSLLDSLFRDVQDKASSDQRAIDALYKRINNLLPEDQGNLQSRYNALSGLFLKTTYLDKRSFVESALSIYEEQFKDAEQRKRKRDDEDQRLAEQKRAQAERERAKQERLLREKRARQYEEGMKSASNWFKSSFKYAIISYFIVGFGGCFLRAGTGQHIIERNWFAPFKSYVNEALYVPLAILAIGIIGSLVMASDAKSRR